MGAEYSFLHPAIPIQQSATSGACPAPQGTLPIAWGFAALGHALLSERQRGQRVEQAPFPVHTCFLQSCLWTLPKDRVNISQG